MCDAQNVFIFTKLTQICAALFVTSLALCSTICASDITPKFSVCSLVSFFNCYSILFLDIYWRRITLQNRLVKTDCFFAQKKSVKCG